MKKRKYNMVETLVDVTDKEIIEEFTKNYPSSFLSFRKDCSHIDELEYFFTNYTELTESDKERIFKKIYELAKLKEEELKEEEKELLQNRSCILTFLEECIDNIRYNSDSGINLLNAEEVLDLILENGRI